jgi:hypothetical protein
MPDISLTSFPNPSLYGGFLIDLDYAVRRDPANGQFNTSGAPHRTGTLPYMAIDILEDPTCPHVYDHDVESFLYVLVWCSVYPASAGSDPLSGWRKGAFKMIGYVKRAGYIRKRGDWSELLKKHLRQGFNHDAVYLMLNEIREAIFYKPGTTNPLTARDRMDDGEDITGLPHQEELFNRVSKAMVTAIEQLES